MKYFFPPSKFHAHGCSVDTHTHTPAHTPRPHEPLVSPRRDQSSLQMCNRNCRSCGNSFTPLLYVKGKILHSDIFFMYHSKKTTSSQMRRTFRLFSVHRLLKQSLMLPGGKNRQVQKKSFRYKAGSEDLVLVTNSFQTAPSQQFKCYSKLKETVTKLFNVCNKKTSTKKKKCSTGREHRTVPLATEKQQSEEQTEEGKAHSWSFQLQRSLPDCWVSGGKVFW